MSKILKVLIIVFCISTLTSCAVHDGMTSNLNNNTTEVVLSKKNYKIIERVTGESQARYILGFGGLSRNGLIAEAKAKMLKNANIEGSSKAIIHETVEYKSSFYYVFYMTKKAIVSAYVVEFTE